MTKKVKLIDPSLGNHDPDSDQINGRIVPVLGDRLVLSGETIEVPDDVAGVAPFWRKPKASDYIPAMDVREGPDGVKLVRDLGKGLLAQTDIWVEVPRETKGDA